MPVRIACCGWQYDDWVGPFYPPALRSRKSEWLAYYGRFFDSVEIDSTYYSFPGKNTVDAWIKKGHAIGKANKTDSGKKGDAFEYSLKMHQSVTHEEMVAGNTAKASSIAKDFEAMVCAPLNENGLLGAVLLQLSPYFQINGKDGSSNLPVLTALLGALDTDKMDCVVEFRHGSWLDGKRKEIVPDALDILRKANAAVCVLDGPGFPVTGVQTASHAYVRFHGRNHDLWYAKEKPDGDARINRYDYLYSEEELAPWVARVKDIEKPQEDGEWDGGDWETRWRDVRVAFNNHGHAKAVRNGLRFREMLGIESGRKGAIDRPSTLEDFA